MRSGDAIFSSLWGWSSIALKYVTPAFIVVDSSNPPKENISISCTRRLSERDGRRSSNNTDRRGFSCRICHGNSRKVN